MTTATTTTAAERDGTHPDPPLLGSVAYLVLNLPAGIASFVFVVTATAVGLGTAIIWVGVGILALAMLAWRGAANLERLRVHAMLGTYVATPYRPLPERMGKRWGARAKDPATWKDLAYFVLLLPVGIAEFTVMVVGWAASLWLVLLPVHYVWLPEEWRAPVWNQAVLRVDSWPQTLPWAALGVLVLAMTITLTRATATLHARFARAMLGPSRHGISRLERLSTAGAIDWSDELPHRAILAHGPVQR